LKDFSQIHSYLYFEFLFAFLDSGTLCLFGNNKIRKDAFFGSFRFFVRFAGFGSVCFGTGSKRRNNNTIFCGFADKIEVEPKQKEFRFVWVPIEKMFVHNFPNGTLWPS
jgi:hypothetical protein